MKILILALLTPFVLSAASCTSPSVEEVRQREAAKTQRYADWQEKRRIRAEAREERDEIWFDRVMRSEDL